MAKYLYSTIKKGKVKVTSKKQHAFLAGRLLPHTHVIQSSSGKIYRERIKLFPDFKKCYEIINKK